MIRVPWISCGVGLLMALTVFTATRPMSPADAVVPPVVAAGTDVTGNDIEPGGSSFDETWRNAAIPLSLRSVMAHRLMIKEIDRGISRDAVAAEPPASSPITIAAASGVSKSTRSERPKRNICQRHGMRKVKHGRYGWRCRK